MYITTFGYGLPLKFIPSSPSVCFRWEYDVVWWSCCELVVYLHSPRTNCLTKPFFSQMSIKFTNEPPQGLKAGLKRTYNGKTTSVILVQLRFSPRLILNYFSKWLQAFLKISWMSAVSPNGNLCFMLWLSYILLFRYERCIQKSFRWILAFSFVNHLRFPSGILGFH